MRSFRLIPLYFLKSFISIKFIEILYAYLQNKYDNRVIINVVTIPIMLIKNIAEYSY
jgi:hypothetical protein